MNPIPITRRNFQKIIQFYLFETPVRTRKAIPKTERDSNDPQAKYKCNFKKVSKRGITFEDRGLDGANLNTVRAAMIRVTNVNLIAVDNIEEVEARVKDENEVRGMACLKESSLIAWINLVNMSVDEINVKF